MIPKENAKFKFIKLNGGDESEVTATKNVLRMNSIIPITRMLGLEPITLPEGAITPHHYTIGYFINDV